MDTADNARDTVWIPAIPLPFFRGWRYRIEQCVCGKKFKGKNRRAEYELHYRREHEKENYGTDTQILMEIEREEAIRIYDEVYK